MPSLVPTCVWTASAQLIVALDGRFGEPIDAYVNGSQVWLREDGPGGIGLEWRLHPVAGYRRPPDIGTYELFDVVAATLADGRPPPLPLDRLWDGLEAFPAYEEETEPAPLSAACEASLGIRPEACGLVDHQRVGDEWERTSGAVSVVSRLLAQLRPER